MANSSRRLNFLSHPFLGWSLSPAAAIWWHWALGNPSRYLQMSKVNICEYMVDCISNYIILSSSISHEWHGLPMTLLVKDTKQEGTWWKSKPMASPDSKKNMLHVIFRRLSRAFIMIQNHDTCSWLLLLEQLLTYYCDDKKKSRRIVAQTDCANNFK